MPEGHTIHRYARLHRGRLAQERVAVSSPQGRFADGAALLDGDTVLDVEAYGKHLFYQWSSGHVLHVHLGLFGKFRSFADDPPPPTEATRLAMTTAESTIYLAGPTACDVITSDDQDTITERLGPDPLRPRASFDAFSRGLERRSIPIAAALLDQKLVAGIGNVYRAEILFLAGIDPHRRSKDLTDEERRTIWDLTKVQLKRGEAAGRIVTVEPSDVGARRRSDLDASTRLYVYKRQGQPCRRCDADVVMGEAAGRSLWWCPTCQPG